MHTKFGQDGGFRDVRYLSSESERRPSRIEQKNHETKTKHWAAQLRHRGAPIAHAVVLGRQSERGFPAGPDLEGQTLKFLG